jgi:transcriptional regulator with XRE-family HTH domain
VATVPVTTNSKTQIIRGIGARVKAMRLEKGLTQQEVAAPHLTRGFISQVENGLIMPSVASLHIIAAKLGKPADWFLKDTSEEELNRLLATAAALRKRGRPKASGRADPQEQLLLGRFRQLNMKNRKLIVLLAGQLIERANDRQENR